MKSVLLDVSGVLRDNLQAIFESYRRVLGPAGWTLDVTPMQAYRLRGFARYNLLENFLEALFALSQEQVPLKTALKWPQRVGLCVQKHPLLDKTEWADKVKKDFRRMDSPYLQSVPVLPGSREALFRLAAKFKIAAVSNSGSSFNKAWLKAHGLDRFFSIFVGEQEVRRKKPHPDGILLACRHLYVIPEQTYFVGDSESDIMAAREARSRPLGVLTGTATREQLEGAGAENVFQNLLELSKTI